MTSPYIESLESALERDEVVIEKLYAEVERLTRDNAELRAVLKSIARTANEAARMADRALALGEPWGFTVEW